MPGTALHPFGEPIETIPLAHPPLERVLAQIRYPHSFEVQEDSFGAGLQRAFRARYPIPEPTTEAVLVPSDAGVGQSLTRLWRFRSLDNAWAVTVAPTFVALETSVYGGHEEFTDHLTETLTAVADAVQPARADRVGVRYTQRLTDREDLDRLAEYVRPEVLGTVGTEARISANLMLSQGDFTTPNGGLIARWGILPAGSSIDPSLPVHQFPTWIFDADAYGSEGRPFDARGLADDAFAKSRDGYRFFRWSVNAAFLIRFGGDPMAVAAALEREGLTE